MVLKTILRHYTPNQNNIYCKINDAIFIYNDEEEIPKFILNTEVKSWTVNKVGDLMFKMKSVGKKQEL